MAICTIYSPDLKTCFSIEYEWHGYYSITQSSGLKEFFFIQPSATIFYVRDGYSIIGIDTRTGEDVHSFDKTLTWDGFIKTLTYNQDFDKLIE